MSTLSLLHVCAVSFWFGVVGAEFVIERSRAESKAHGYSVARNHFWIDVLLELPAALVVLITGAFMLGTVPMTSLFTAKIAAGVVAVGVNVLCLIPVAQRRVSANADRLPDVIRLSRVIDRITVIGLPAGVVALAIGLLAPN